MTKLLQQAIEALRQLPDDQQDTAARALLWQFAEAQLDERDEVAGKPGTERD